MWFLQTSTHGSVSQYDEFNECCGSLSPACLDKVDENPGSTLQVNSEEYLDYLTSCVLRFVPLVGNRALNQYMDPVV